jgi:AcrR family transcriptional regulator
MTAATGARERPYHHGDARNALLGAARRLLERDGAAGLSLRQVAEQAGLSRQAPYNHFINKEALLAELVAEGYVQLKQEVERAAAANSDPGARLAAVAEAYLAFAQRNPMVFRLMFSRDRVDLRRHRGALEAAQAALDAVAAMVRPLASRGDARGLVMATWSIVHGYAVLCIEAEIEPESARRKRADQFARFILKACELPE